MEDKKVERSLMGLEEFKNYVASNLQYFELVSKYKSIKRAIRRGHVTSQGVQIPKRPFSNRRPTSGRSMNELKKDIFIQVKKLQRNYA